jgi:hypothetical protein
MRIYLESRAGAAVRVEVISDTTEYGCRLLAVAAQARTKLPTARVVGAQGVISCSL